MSNYLKRFLSLAMAVIMVLAYVPATVFAEEPAECSHSYENGVCTQCGAEEIVEEPTECSHVYDDGVVTPPTCGAEGYTTYTCTVCGESYTDNKQEATGAHVYENGTCTGCGGAEPALLVDEPVTPPAQPTATVSDAVRDGAAFAIKFVADEMTTEQQTYYGGWNADLVLKVNKELTMNNSYPAEYSYLSIDCPAMGFNWTDMPGSLENNVVIPANTPWGLLEFGNKTVPYTQFDALGGVGYAAIFQEEYLEANPGLVATVSLVLTSPDGSETVTVATHKYTSPYKIPDLPGATVTNTPADKLDPDVPLTFAKTFTADTPDEAQGAYYGDWYADFVLTVNEDVTFNADGSADGYLAGQYDGWEIPGFNSEDWIKVPAESVTLEVGESLRIMEYAAKTLNQPGLQFTYADVVESVKSFNCGTYFTPAFLEAHPDFEVKLELRLYETKDSDEGKAIGESFSFTAEDALPPALPTATVTDTKASELNDGMTLTFAKTFTANEPSPEQAAYYGEYYADFVLTVNTDVTLNADSDTADGYLSGQYDGWEIPGFNSENWINVPAESVTLKAGEELRIMQYAAKMLNQPGLKMTYEEIVENVGTFNCGAYFTPEFLAANPGFEVSLELRLYEPDNEEVSYTVGETQEFAAADVPALPTATVADIVNKDMTFAKNFKVDEITAAQLAYYGNWYADFELTINQDVTFDANGGADGYLSGQYDGWEVPGLSFDSENWYNVPPTPVTLKANEPLKIMEYAAELLGEPGLKYTYKEVFEAVKDFNCGVFFEPAFLLELEEELEVTLELRMYSPADESYTIGDSYKYTIPVAPDFPTATVKEIDNDDLTFAMNFKVDEITEDQLAYFGNWYADFELTINQDVTFDANGGADGYLSGQYDGWEIPGFNSADWINVPPKAVTLKANEPLKIMEYAAELLGEPGLKYTYKEVYENVKDFDCGVFFEPEFLVANPDLKVTLELKMYHPQSERKGYIIGETYTFENNFVAYNTATEKVYTTVTAATLDAAAGQTVELLCDVTESQVIVTADVTLDLNGHTLETGYFSCFGDIVDNDAAKVGTLKVDSTRLLIQKSNAMLPVKTADGYKFVAVTDIATGLFENNTKFAFVPKFNSPEDKEPIAHELLAKGLAVTGVTFNVEISWKQVEGMRSQSFVYTDAMMQNHFAEYDPNEGDYGKYGKMFTLVLKNAGNLEDLTFTAMVVSDTGVQVRAAGRKPTT